MAKKKKAKQGAARLKEKALTSAHKVWLAGLGALAHAEEGGSKLFNSLAEKGAAVEERGKPVVERLSKSAGEGLEKAGKQAARMGEEARANLEKVGRAVDEGVTAALHRLGIPTRAEIEALTRRVETLTRHLEEQQAAAGPARQAPGKKTARGRPARKAAGKPAKKAAKKVAKKVAKKAVRKSAEPPAPTSSAAAPARRRASRRSGKAAGA